AQIRDGAADVLDDRGLDALGGLVQQQQFRPHHQRPADRQLLLLPAGEVATATPQHRIEHRKQREHVVGNVAVLTLERPEAGLEIFFHRQQRKNLAALRHEADTGPCALVRFETGDVVTFKGDRAARYRILADHRTQQRGLADAVAAEHAGHLARLRRQRDTAQRLRGAVVKADVVDLQHLALRSGREVASYPAKAGYPVRRASAVNFTVSEYWIVRLRGR